MVNYWITIQTRRRFAARGERGDGVKRLQTLVLSEYQFVADYIQA